MTKPEIGVFLPTMSEPGEALADLVAAARHAEALGFESGWAVDQLIAGTGAPFVDSTVALAAAAGATTTLRLAYGVLVLPIRPVVWAARQAGSLQQVSGGRLILGVGVGGDRHDRSWAAAGAPRRERGRRTDEALAVLPALLRGETVDLDGVPVDLQPGVPVPPIVVGGMAEAALARAVAHGDGWFGMPLPPARLVPAIARLGELAAAAGRARPELTASTAVAIDGDPRLPDRAGLVRRLSDPDGVFGMPAEAVPELLVTGPPAAVAERLDALAELGAARVVVTLAAGDWFRQAELLAEAVALAA